MVLTSLKSIGLISSSLLIVAIGFVGAAWWALQPHTNVQPLPSSMVAAETPQGLALLRESEAFADHAVLSRFFVAQNLKSYCGVASSVTVLSALGKSVSQRDFFTDKASQIRSRLRVMLTGIPLSDLGDLLHAHGAEVSVHHANTFDVGAFRHVVLRNLATADDFILVNYQRETLGQESVGHISPLAAYDQDTDMVLVLDTASHKYPHTWVSLKTLVRAMATIDSETGQMRGFIEVTGLKQNS